MFEFSALPPLSLYVHLPWCVHKCPYCDFNSHELRDPLPEREYVDALIADLDQDLKRVWNRPVHTVFFGGGTPSLFTPDAVDRLLAALRARLPIVADAEITLEANPGTVEQDRFQGYRQAGINRLSIGIQSFNDAKLRALGRIHGREESLRAAEAARATGFGNFNLDLMYGLPNQSVDEALGDLGTAMALHPTHLSLYQLTIEPNTLFHAQPPPLPDEEILWTMQHKLEFLLVNAGYHHYEVSAYARDGRRCRHNLNYWRFGDYLGIGAGAHAKISDAQGITRLWKLKQPAEYLAKAATPAVVGGERRLTPDEAGFEFMLNALRLTDGFETDLFHQRTGLPWALVEPAVKLAANKGLVEETGGRLKPSETGRRFLNDLQALFLADPGK